MKKDKIDPREEKAHKQIRILCDYKDFFDTEKGKNVLYDLCKRFHYFQTSYNGNVNDTIYREGERNVLNFILLQTQQDPNRILEEFRSNLKKEMEYEYDRFNS